MTASNPLSMRHAPIDQAARFIDGLRDAPLHIAAPLICAVTTAVLLGSAIFALWHAI
jgi:hypothetical protein